MTRHPINLGQVKKVNYTLTLILFFLFTWLNSTAQLLHWNRCPQTGYVFQITNREAQRILTRSRPDTIINSMLHTMIDTFNVNKGWLDRPEKGHFILATIVENKLHCEYTAVFPYQVFLMKEYEALSLQVVDKDGNVRGDAKVKFRWKRLEFDPESQTYRIEHQWFPNASRFVTVELDGFRAVFNIEKHEVPQWYNNWYDRSGPDFYSYMITDKNKYKPSEKVRFKSYALSQSRTPLRKDLELWLSGDGKLTKLLTVTPHRPGSFAGEFQLHDSLKISLDKSYMLQLRNRQGRIVSTCSFHYEDYELNGNRLFVELSNSKQYHPAANQLTITATDVNGLMLKDAKATVLVKTKAIRETFQSVIDFPDTLLLTEINLDAENPTTITIPSTLFGKANVVYDVTVVMTNTQHQRLEQTVTAMYCYSQYETVARLSADSIVYELFNNGRIMRGVPGTLKHSHEVKEQQVIFPYRERLNPVVSVVSLKTGVASRDVNMRAFAPQLKLTGGIEKDSFNILLDNPQKLEVSWYVYQGSRLLQKGFGNEIDFKSRIEDYTQTFYVELLYSFGGQENILRRDYPFKTDRLNVSLELPERVYPGQEVQALIRVTNQLGSPVRNVDLTALTVTNELGYYLPDLPYYGSTSAPRPKKAHYTKNDVKRNAILNLNYKKWLKLARLDTMKYYQFIYPGSKMFTYTVPIKDSTQFSVYAMKNGNALKIHVIEVNHEPVYFEWTDQPNRYSFYIKPGIKQQVSLRLYDRVLILDSLTFEQGKKTIVSLDMDHLPSTVKVIRLYRPSKKGRKRTYPTLTSVERSRYESYVAAFKKSTGTAYLLSARGAFTPLFSRWRRVPYAIKVGPVSPGLQTFIKPDSFRISYKQEGGFTYSFEDNVVYKLDADKLLPDVLSDGQYSPATTMSDVVMTKKEFLSYWPEPQRWHPAVIQLVDNSMRVSIVLPDEKEKSGVAGVQFHECSSGEIVLPCRTYSESDKHYFTIPRGCYHVVVLYNNGNYLKTDSVKFESHHRIRIDLSTASFQQADSLSLEWLGRNVNNCYGPEARPYEMQDRTMQLHLSAASYGNIRGMIFDEANKPLPGATIVIKGTAEGAVSDLDGHFYLNTSQPAVTLVVSFIGYEMQEVEVQPGSEVTIVMTPDIRQLSEVVVVGYGMQRRADLTGAISGRLAGVTAQPDDSEIDTRPIVMPDSTSRAEQKLYQELLMLQHVRSTFDDVAFWEPKLFTDKHGKSTFTVKFSDNITRWDATVYAMNKHLQTGTVRKTIKSYKPIMAELQVPGFLTRGDSAQLLGKILNYSRDKSIRGKVIWEGASTTVEKDVTLDGIHADKLSLYVASTDTVTSQYTFTRDDGYFDGEKRSIPVVEQGVMRAEGKLGILKNGDEVNVKASSQETVTVEIISNPLDIYAGDAMYLVDYKYACNEQLASRLIGLVQCKLIMQYQGKPFRYDKDVNKVIARLLKNQNGEFLWSWWDVSPSTSYWMSAHILRALKVAKDAGYTVDLDMANLVRKITYKFDFLSAYSQGDIELLNALAAWNASLNYRRYISRLDSLLQYDEQKYHYRYSLLKDKMLLIELRQLSGIDYNPDALLKYRRTAMLDQLYFTMDKPARYWYEDDLAANVIAYRIISRDSTLQYLREPMQLYFLSTRKNGAWNTYHCSNVLMAVLPDVIASGASKEKQATVSIHGKVNETITHFPYTLELNGTDSITVKKESGLPLYYMFYTMERVIEAKTGKEGFSIRTTIGGGDDNVTLTAGKPVRLAVEVDVLKKTSEYVMIEAPIPAGCSYADKTINYTTVETHREYFRDKTVIFCENLREGKYVFVIYLLPRFTGTYNVNPAQVSLMYMPVVNANTEMKIVKVVE